VGVIVWPPLFGLGVEWLGGFRPAWVALAGSMLVALALLGRVKDPTMAR